jgi:hypothetical protein
MKDPRDQAHLVSTLTYPNILQSRDSESLRAYHFAVFIQENALAKSLSTGTGKRRFPPQKYFVVRRICGQGARIFNQGARLAERKKLP